MVINNCEKTFTLKFPCKKNNKNETFDKEIVQDVFSKTNSTKSQQMLFNQLDYLNKTRKELITICKENKIKGYNRKKKENIIDILKN